MVYYCPEQFVVCQTKVDLVRCVWWSSSIQKVIILLREQWTKSQFIVLFILLIERSRSWSCFQFLLVRFIMWFMGKARTWHSSICTIKVILLILSSDASLLIRFLSDGNYRASSVSYLGGKWVYFEKKENGSVKKCIAIRWLKISPDNN